MATSKGANTYNRQNWEDAEFPILCQTCLGDNPYVRMMKEKYGKECKICQRPFTIFKWCPGARMRYKKTEVCQTCSKLKNVCQTCLLDLEYGLPVQVRDNALAIKDEMPKSDVNKEFYTQNMERELASTDGTTPGGALGKAQAPSDLLMKLARTTPYYKRNRPHICSFWVKGECKRGEECPYRHEMPTDPTDPLACQNIKDRYYGMNDPVADKLMTRASTMPKIEPPKDKTVTTLYVGGLDGKVSEADLRDHFYQFGELRQVSLVTRQNCAFVCFTTRGSAEMAAEKSFNKLLIKGRRLKILWGKSQADQQTAGAHGGLQLTPVPGLPSALPAPPVEHASSSEASSTPDAPAVSSATATAPNLPPPPHPSSGMGPLPPGMMMPGHGAPMPPMGMPQMRFPHGRMPPPPPRGMPPPHIHRYFPPPPRGPPPRGIMPPRGPPPMNMMRGPPPVHYPSQDPHRMGAGKNTMALNGEAAAK